MPNRNTILATISGLMGMLILLVAVVPVPIAPNAVQISWVTQPETTYINVWNTNANELVTAHGVSSGITNTLTLSATEGVVFQIQEYKLVNGRLELVTFFNADPVPVMPTQIPTIKPTQTPQPSVTPNPTATPISGMKPRMLTALVMR